MMMHEAERQGMVCTPADGAQRCFDRDAEGSQTSLLQLPGDVLLAVCSHLPAATVAALSVCCLRLRDRTGAPLYVEQRHICVCLQIRSGSVAVSSKLPGQGPSTPQPCVSNTDLG